MTIRERLKRIEEAFKPKHSPEILTYKENQDLESILKGRKKDKFYRILIKIIPNVKND